MTMSSSKQNSPAVVNKVLTMAVHALWEAAWTTSSRADDARCCTMWLMQGIDETRAALVDGSPELALQRLDAVRAKAASYRDEAAMTEARDVEVARKASALAEAAGIDVTPEPENVVPDPQGLLLSALRALGRLIAPKSPRAGKTARAA
jgi:nucleotide-binding universal stress UspA family protein